MTLWPPLWFERSGLKSAVTAGFILLIVIKFVHAVFFKQNDFDVHLEWGKLALLGTYYSDEQAWSAVFFQYPPGRTLLDEFLSILPHYGARALVFCAAIA